MTVPGSTYRLQLRGGMDFAKARAIVPYLARLGITHLYLSPIFTAEPGSTHGYDVTDCNEIDPTLGGRDGFEALCEELRSHGLGLLIDIVPNHMAASLANSWWRDVLEHGQASAYAGHFDIDWSQPLTLPVLGKPFAEALAAGELRLEPADDGRGWALAYFDQRFPLAPETGDLSAAGADPDLITRLHESQHWRLTFWKEASRHLSYRRFFEVTGLVGMRVEDPTVFEATHRLIFELVDKGLVQGLRVDHVDGLSDPTGYLRRLRRRIGPDLYLVVEKIIEGDEELPKAWPVQGTTGYEFIAAMAAALVDAEGFGRLGETLAEITGAPFDAELETRAAKTQMVSVNFAGEVERLVELAAGATGLDREALREAIREMLIAFPVYRSYADAEGASPADAALIEEVRSRAVRHADPRAVEAVASLVAQRRSIEFQTRFQQLSGPIMAKAVEDTLFYRDVRALALNEVGGDPQDGRQASSDSAHRRITALVASQPHGMRATATHDTKRGEDARARIYALTEMPDDFAQGVRRWNAMPDGPEAQTRWTIYQALAGIWPAEPPADTALDVMRERFLAYLEKAMREEKRETDWTEPDAAYEGAVLAYADRLFGPSGAAFRADFTAFVKRLHLPGWMNSLVQTTLKLTLPGVPDVYQGTELFDDSLVDPDNRRPVPFHHLAEGPRDERLLWQNWRDPCAKQALIQSLLPLKKATDGQQPAIYEPLRATGPASRHVFAFATRIAGRHALVAVPRLTASLFDSAGSIPTTAWTGTALPPALPARMSNLLTGERVTLEGDVPLDDLFAAGPIAILVAD